MTGQFNEEGLIDDISDFTPHQMHEIHDWQQFYFTSYTYLGLSSSSHCVAILDVV